MELFEKFDMEDNIEVDEEYSENEEDIFMPENYFTNQCNDNINFKNINTNVTK